ncbi:MAG: TonB-dependent receptor [Flavobacteriaceae bacterium]|nr:TonB-dependent receptor [Flavobacteriaceae bacterium]
MSKKGLLNFLCISFFLCSNYLASQNIQENQLLTEILKTLQVRYDCSFSYSNDDVQNIKILTPSSSLSFDEAIDYLRNNTNLDFNILENRLITIVKPDDILLSICGTILDDETQFPIVGVSIVTGSKSAVSDKKGFFRIEDVKLTDILNFHHISYKDHFLITKKDINADCLTVNLSPNVEELNEVVISNFITKGINKTTSGAININYNQFGILPGLIDTDALQTVQSIPGINSLHETVTNINIRGGSNDQNLFTWNHIKMYQTGHFFNLISAFNPSIKDRVNLYKNGSPAAYTDGVSGTVGIYSTNTIANKFKSEISLNLIDGSILFDIPLGKNASINIAGRRSYSDIFDTFTSKNYFKNAFQNTEIFQNIADVISERNNFKFYDVEAILNYNISQNDKLKISFITMDNDLSFFESAFINNEEVSRESRSKQNNSAIGLWYQHRWSRKLQTTLQMYGLKYNLRAKNADILNDKQLVQENSIDETDIKIVSTYELNNNVSLTAGYNFNESGIYNLEESNNPLFRIFSKDVLRKHALFTEGIFDWFDGDTKLKPGVRINYIQRFNVIIAEPRLSFNQKISKNLLFNILGEFKHQTTTQTVDFQNDFLGIENRRWIASNTKDIPIIKSKQLSTGFTYKNNNWLVDIDMYYKNVEGVVAQSQEFQNQYQFSKATGKYAGMGTDIFISKKINDLSLWGSYSYQDLNYEFETLQASKFPNNFNINHALNLGVSYNYKNFKIATGLQWRTGRAITNPVSGNEVINNTINYESANSSNLPYYFRWDASMTYDFTIRNSVNVSTGISLWNITNKRNIIDRYFEFTDVNFPSPVTQNALQFTPNALVRVKF